MITGQIQASANQGIVKKLIKRYGWAYLLEWLPVVGFLIPGDIILVWRTLKGDIVGPEGALMLPIAIIAYGVKIIFGLVGFFVSFGILGTLLNWLIAGFFAIWIFSRGSGSTGGTQTKGKDSQTPETQQENKETVQENKEAVNEPLNVR